MDARGTVQGAVRAGGPSLIVTIGFWIIVAAGAGIVLHVGYCTWRALSQPGLAARHFMVVEAEHVAVTLLDSTGALRRLDAAASAHAMSQLRYDFRIVSDTGHVVAHRNGDGIAALAPVLPEQGGHLYSWLSRIGSNGFHFVGGVAQTIGKQSIRIELSTARDPIRAWWAGVFDDVFDDGFESFIVTTMIELAFSLLAVNLALRPMKIAVQQLASIDAKQDLQPLQIDRLPQEAASFASAINRLLAAVGENLRAREMMYALLAHEVRRPMTAMTLELDSRKDPSVARLRTEIARMQTCVHQLMLLAAPQVEDRSVAADAIDLDDCARGAIAALVSLAASRCCKVEFSSQSPGEIHGNPMVIKEAICNVVENAIKHTPPGAQIVVTTGPGGLVTIDDDGPGLSPGRLVQLIQPFQRDSTKTDGWGLGLTIVKRAVDLHGGRVEVMQSPSGGTRFKLYFSGGCDAIAAGTVHSKTLRLAGAQPNQPNTQLQPADH